MSSPYEAPASGEIVMQMNLSQVSGPPFSLLGPWFGCQSTDEAEYSVSCMCPTSTFKA